MILVLLPGTFIRFDSLRIGETLLEAKRVPDALLVIHGTDDALRFHTRVTVDCGVLPDGYDGAWTRTTSERWVNRSISLRF